MCGILELELYSAHAISNSLKLARGMQVATLGSSNLRFCMLFAYLCDILELDSSIWHAICKLLLLLVVCLLWVLVCYCCYFRCCSFRCYVVVVVVLRSSFLLLLLLLLLSFLLLLLWLLVVV
jgi:hypothetical protein